jgi:hypothetical protein
MKPLFRLLGTQKNKRRAVYGTGNPREESIKESLDWLDHICGR